MNYANKSAKMAEKTGKVRKYLHMSEKSCTFARILCAFCMTREE